METFVAMRVFVDSWRWGGVPFYVRAGKRMPPKTTYFHPKPRTGMVFRSLDLP